MKIWIKFESFEHKNDVNRIVQQDCKDVGDEVSILSIEVKSELGRPNWHDLFEHVEKM